MCGKYGSDGSGEGGGKDWLTIRDVMWFRLVNAGVADRAIRMHWYGKRVLVKVVFVGRRGIAKGRTYLEVAGFGGDGLERDG